MEMCLTKQYIALKRYPSTRNSPSAEQLTLLIVVSFRLRVHDMHLYYLLPEFFVLIRGPRGALSKGCPLKEGPPYY